MPVLFRLDIVAPESDFPLAEALVARAVSSGWEEESLSTGETRLRVHCEEREILDALADEVKSLLPEAVVERAEVQKQDWTAAWRDFFMFCLPGWRMPIRKDACPFLSNPSRLSAPATTPRPPYVWRHCRACAPPEC